MIRRATLTTAIIGLLLSGGAVAQQHTGVIPSNDPAALDVPDEWDCERYYAEYRKWLDDGNDAADWKFVGKVYRDVSNGETYTWQDWLDWADEEGCAAIVADLPPGTAGAVNAGVALTATAAMAFGSGLVGSNRSNGPKSPG